MTTNVLYKKIKAFYINPISIIAHTLKTMKSVPATTAFLTVTAMISQSSAFAPQHSTVFGIHVSGITRPLSSSHLSMAVMPGDDWEQNKRQTDADASDMSSSFTGGQPSGLPLDNILPLEETDGSSFSNERLDRIKLESDTKSRFLHGDELVELRKYMKNLATDIETAREKGDISTLRDLTKALKESKEMDAEHVYAVTLELYQNAIKNKEENEAEKYKKEIALVKECMPHFQLGGLWVGKYGEHGYEMINVTYVGEFGDTLVATKVTGDKNVPKGEITFTADLNPKVDASNELDPIELSDVAAKQWGHKHLPRFSGKGQVAAEGFVNNQWMDGQVILVGDYFSFAWLPIGHQIFFGRPSAELTLKMLKQSKMADYGAVDKDSPNAVAEQRAFISRCFEETELMLFDEEADGELCFLTDDNDYFCQEGCFE